MKYNVQSVNIPGVRAVPSNVKLPNYVRDVQGMNKSKPQPKIGPVNLKLQRAINFYADTGGCAFWRMGWPEYLINSKQKACINGLGVMITDGAFYKEVKAIKLQRQCTTNQYAFAKALKEAQSRYNYRLIYEVDDIIFAEDIPDYNACKVPFMQNVSRDSILKSIEMMDEFTVTCDFMRDYYKEKTGFNNITVIPNYPPKFWIDRYYNRQSVAASFEANQRRPRVLYSGSGIHADVSNVVNQQDDFEHVVDAIIKARKDFKFVWKGCYPMRLKPYIDSGEMEFFTWDNLHEYPEGILRTGSQISFASLRDNNFNKAKSNIKMLETGALGIPGSYQDICTYKDSLVKFRTGDDLIDTLKHITSSIDTYMFYSDRARSYVESMWLDDHLDQHLAVYFTDYGSKERASMSPTLIDLNPSQKIIT